MSTTRRILLVGRGLPERGGISVFLHGLAEIERPGWTFELLNLTRDDDMGTGGALDLANVRRTLGDTAAVFRRAGAADLVHIHSALSPAPTLIRAGLLTVAARLRRRPVVIHAHGGRLLEWADRPARRRLVRAVLGRAGRVLAVSAGVAEVIRSELGAERVDHVPNGVDTDRFRPAPDRADEPTILYVGILTERKGVLDLVEASALLAGRGVEHRLVLVGGRPDEGDVEHARVLAAIEASSAPVELAGPVDHDAIANRYRRATVFCLPSWWEAMPLSILEAMACGIPVVASDVGDVAETLGTTGRLVTPKDPTGLADALEPYLADPDLAQRAGAAARRRVEDTYSIESTHDAIVHCYQELLR